MTKRNKRLAGLLTVLILTMGILGGCGGEKLSDQFDEDAIKAKTVEAIGYFNEREYQKILDMGDQQMKNSLTKEQFAEAVDPYLDKCGAFEKIEKEIVTGTTDKETGKKYALEVAVGKYADGKIQFTVGFDTEMQLVQFYIK